jgi:hypothetical protein
VKERSEALSSVFLNSERIPHFRPDQPSSSPRYRSRMNRARETDNFQQGENTVTDQSRGVQVAALVGSATRKPKIQN